MKFSTLRELWCSTTNVNTVLVYVINMSFFYLNIKARIRRFKPVVANIKTTRLTYRLKISTWESLLCSTSSHERNIHAFLVSQLSDSKQSGTFINIGAHIGKYPILLEGYFDKVVAIEPTPETFSRLKENIALNGISNKVVLLQVACSDRVGFGKFLTRSNESENKLLYPENLSESCDPTVVVAVEKLDNLLDVNDVETARLLVIDAEGEELRVLRGARKLLRKNILIVIEILNDTSLNLIIDFLAEFDYQPATIDKNYYLFKK